jgi:hypothetical protein
MGNRPAEWTGAAVKLPIRLTVLSVAATPALQAAVVLQYHHVGMTTPASTSTPRNGSRCTSTTSRATTSKSSPCSASSTCCVPGVR